MSLILITFKISLIVALNFYKHIKAASLKFNRVEKKTVTQMYSSKVVMTTRHLNVYRLI